MTTTSRVTHLQTLGLNGSDAPSPIIRKAFIQRAKDEVRQEDLDALFHAYNSLTGDHDDDSLPMKTVVLNGVDIRSNGLCINTQDDSFCVKLHSKKADTVWTFREEHHQETHVWIIFPTPQRPVPVLRNIPVAAFDPEPSASHTVTGKFKKTTTKYGRWKCKATHKYLKTRGWMVDSITMSCAKHDVTPEENARFNSCSQSWWTPTRGR